MSPPSDKDNNTKDKKEKFQELIGLGGASMRKSYYPELRRKIEELHQLKNYLDNVINSMPSALIGIDTQLSITLMNKEAEKLAGISLDKASGQPFHEVFPSLSGETERVRQALKEKQVRKNPKGIIKIQGESRVTEITVFPLVANGIMGAVIRLDDITERIRMEEMVIQSEKMLSVGGLAAGMAHEINNPLAGILQNMQVLESRLFKDNPKNIRAAGESGTTLEAIRGYLERRGLLATMHSIMDSGKRAARIVENMLNFSRKSDSGKLPQNIPALLDKTVDLVSNDYNLKEHYDFRQITIAREYDENLPSVPCNGNKLQQVFLNLIKNAAQAMAENPDKNKEILLKLRVREENDGIRVEIEDTGPGMPENTRKRVFEPFFTTREPGTGTGLGLSVSYFIITEHIGGTMTVESTPGHGTKFIIHLPFP